MRGDGFEGGGTEDVGERGGGNEGVEEEEEEEAAVEVECGEGGLKR